MTVPVNVKTFPATEAIAVGSVVTDNGAGSVLNADAITERTLGICIVAATADNLFAGIQLDGTFEFALVDGNAGAIVVGDRLSPSATDGKMIVHDDAAATVYAAKALGASTTDNDFIPVLIASGRADNA